MLMRFKIGDLVKINCTPSGTSFFISAWKSNELMRDTVDNEMVNIQDGSLVLILDSWYDDERDLVFVKFLLGNELFFIEEYYLEK